MANYTSMTNDELIRHVVTVGASRLEIELAMRLERVLETLESKHGDDTGGPSQGGRETVSEGQGRLALQPCV